MPLGGPWTDWGPYPLGTAVKKGCGYSVGKSHKPRPFSCSLGLHLQQPQGQKPVTYRHAGSSQARELTHGGQGSIGLQVWGLCGELGGLASLVLSTGVRIWDLGLSQGSACVQGTGGLQ